MRDRILRETATIAFFLPSLAWWDQNQAPKGDLRERTAAQADWQRIDLI